MSAMPSPTGWVIPNSDTTGFAFKSAVSSVNVDSLSDQALALFAKTPNMVILPDNSPGDVSETRVEFALMAVKGFDNSAGIVFGFQDLDNYLAVETLIKGGGTEIEQIVLNEKVNGSISRLTSSGSTLSLRSSQGWIDIRIQVFRPSSSEVSFRVSAADHGNKYQPVATETFNDSDLAFTSGDVGLTGGHEIGSSGVAFDGDPVGSGGRPIKMYWA